MSAFWEAHPFWSSLIAVVAFLLVPSTVAYFAFANLTWTQLKGPIYVPILNNAFSNIPTAWDSVASDLRGGQFVRVRLLDGTWVGGWFSTKSFMSTYPEPRDLFIEAQYVLSSRGQFRDRVEGTSGVWVNVPDGAIVEWIDQATDNGEGGR